MNYIELAISGLGPTDPDIIVAMLGEIGFESFSEEEGTLLAYAQEGAFEEGALTDYITELTTTLGVHPVRKVIPRQNWNEEWEKAFKPVTIAGLCHVRAPFHPPAAEIRYDIVIEPKMSFGTAHHETTALMITLLMKEELKGKTVLDMGCGTGILAILAAKMEAAEIAAIDNDMWAFENASENAERNQCPGVRVLQGDAGSIPDMMFDVIIANINRNVLLADIPEYCRKLKQGATLLLSGFYVADLAEIKHACEECGLELVGYATDNDWVGAKFA